MLSWEECLELRRSFGLFGGIKSWGFGVGGFESAVVGVGKQAKEGVVALRGRSPEETKEGVVGLGGKSCEDSL